MRTHKKYSIVWGLLLGLGVGQAAWAKDDLQVEVFADGAIVTPNGAATGTIHVNYTVGAHAFTPGPFRTLDVDLASVAGTGKNAAVYPLTLSLSQKQQGASSLELTPAPASFEVAGQGGIGVSRIAVAIPANTSNVDGETLVGVLQFEAPNKSNFDTNTTVLVKVTLVHPIACLRLVGFLTNDDGLVDSVAVRLRTDRRTGAVTVNGTVPGQVFDNLLLVNLCGEDRVVDLQLALDPAFDTNPSGNPGNAVQSYLASGAIDTPSGTITAQFGPGTPQGQQLCLSNFVVPANQTALVVVHSDIRKGEPASTLPADGTFEFTSTVFQTGSAGCTAGTLHPDAEPNPEVVSLPFTTSQ